MIESVSAGGSSSDILIASPGAVSLATLTAGRSIRIGDGAPAASAKITGAVTAGGDYVVNAGAITLGGTTPVRQQAKGAVTITGGAGGITGAAGLTLVSNSDASRNEALTLAIDPASAADGTSGGAITFAASTLLQGGRRRIRMSRSARPRQAEPSRWATSARAGCSARSARDRSRPD